MSFLTSDLKIIPQEIFTSSSTQGTTLGARATTGDGRYYRYVLCDASTATVQGKLYMGQPEVSASWDDLAITAASGVIGSTALVTTSTPTLSANQLAGGYLTAPVTPGEGYQYKIKGNTVGTGATAITIYLEDPVIVAITASSEVDVVPNPYNGAVIWNKTTHLSAPVGISVYPITAAQYGWIQVKGPCVALCDDDAGGLTVGRGIEPSDDVNGAVGGAVEIYGQIGYALTTTPASEYGFVMLNLF